MCGLNGQKGFNISRRQYTFMYKNDKSGEKAVEFYRKFLEKFKPRVKEIEVNGQKVKRLVFEEHVDGRDFVFPSLFENDEVILEYPDPKTGLKWVGKFPFKHAVFKKGVSFSEATFEGVVSFYGATFEDSVDFNNTTFEGYVSFDRVMFKGVAQFKGAKFKNVKNIFHPHDIGQQWRFQREVSPEVRVGHMDPLKPQVQKINEFYRFSATFINAEFRDRVNFSNAEFYGAVRFNFSEFGVNVGEDSLDPVDFEEAKFLGPSTEFFKCTFFAETSFLKTEFWGYVDFEESTFKQSSHFDRSEFLVDVESKDVGYFGFSPINFRRTNFKKDVSFRGVEFYSKSNFSKARFEGSVAFTRDMGAGTKECTFHRGADFIRCVFEKEVDFQWSIFHKPKNTVINHKYKYPQTNFARSRFGGSVHFNFAKFGKVIFNLARFLGQVGFAGTEFNGHLHIREAVFEDIVLFSSAKFNDVDIEGSRFQGAVIFSEGKLNGKFRVYHSTFEREALFGKGGYKEEGYSQLEFLQDEHPFILEWVVFDDHVSFTEIVFLPPVKIIGCKFNGHVSFKDAIFKKDAKFDYCLINGSVSFIGKQSEHYKFFKTLSFDGISVSGTVSFVKSNSDNELEEEFKSMFRIPQALIEAARVQRLSFEHEGKRDEADKMFALEMRTRRRIRSKSKNMKIHSFLEWLIGDLPSEYGTNWRRIIWMSLMVVLYFGIAYWLEILSYSFYAEYRIKWFKWLDIGMLWTLLGASYFVILYYRGVFEDIETLEELIRGVRHYWRYWTIILSIVYLAWILLSNTTLPFNARVLNNATIQLPNNGIVALNPDNPGSVMGTLLNALYYSLVTFTTLGYGDMHPTSWLKALSAIEALTGAVFMALIVAVIARKWMR